MLRIPVVVLQGGVAFVVAAGLLGAHLSPGGPLWWTAMAAVTLPYVSVLLAVTTVLCIPVRAWTALGFGLVLLVAVGARLLPGAPAELEEGAGDLVLMTFNVPRHGPTAEQLAADLFALVRAERPHLMALQATTAWRPPQAGRRATVADYVQPVMDSLGYRLSIPQELPYDRTPQPVLTRQSDGPTVLSQEAITLESVPQDPLATQAVRTHLRWQGREAIHYNVHLRGFGPEKPWDEEAFPHLHPREWLPFLRRYRRAYRNRAADVRALRERIARETLPVIISGDFNATEHNWEYRQLRRGRTDAFRQAGRGNGNTYHAHRPLVRIDHVIVDPAFEVVTAHVPDVRFSDHRPVVARVRWRPDGH